MIPNRKKTALACAVPLLSLLAGCGGDGDGGDGGHETEPPHGYVAGAEETAEPQPRLVVADAGSGAVRVLDLLTEEAEPAGQVDGVQDIHGDGRFAYLTAADGLARVVDSGVWTVDHGEHSHYYRTEVRELGDLSGERLVGVHSDTSVTAVTFGDGTVSLLDRPALEGGSVTQTGTFAVGGDAGAAVPYAGQVLVPVAEPGQDLAHAVEVRSREGERVSELDEPCPRLRSVVTTSHGPVFGCADGALLVTEDDGIFTGEKIPYPEPVSEEERAREFSHRPGSGTVAAPAGERGVWTLDVAARTWDLVETGPVVAANAVGDGATLLTLTADGVLHSYDIGSGEETAHTDLLADPPPGDADPTPVIHVDTSRAYVNDPAAGAIHEIDYQDGLRLARTIPAGITPTHMVETGR